MHVLLALFFLAVLAGAALGLWRTVRKDLLLIVAALGYRAPGVAPSPLWRTAGA